MKWIDQVLELALERVPQALPEKEEVKAPLPAVVEEQAPAAVIKH